MTTKDFLPSSSFLTATIILAVLLATTGAVAQTSIGTSSAAPQQPTPLSSAPPALPAAQPVSPSPADTTVQPTAVPTAPAQPIAPSAPFGSAPEPTQAAAAPATSAPAPVTLSQNNAAPRQPIQLAQPQPVPTAPQKETPEKINMAKRLGFAVGLAGGSETTPLVVGTHLGLRAWLSDTVALQPSLQMDVGYNSSSEILQYGATPGIGLLFAIYRGMNTRVNFGFGVDVGFYGRKSTADTDTDTFDTSDSSMLYRPAKAYSGEGAHDQLSSEMSVGTKATYLALPLDLQIEHFFSNRFSGFVGAKFPLVRLIQVRADEGDTDPQTDLEISLKSTSLVMGLIFYTN